MRKPALTTLLKRLDPEIVQRGTAIATQIRPSRGSGQTLGADGRWYSSPEAAARGPKPTPHRIVAQTLAMRRRDRQAESTVVTFLRRP